MKQGSVLFPLLFNYFDMKILIADLRVLPEFFGNKIQVLLAGNYLFTRRY